ncbi:hypothetical protein HanHA300_Chr16g0624571 [Helianthus annuus]|uniref:Uncharacterized protein n=1 Tax=Helianthus annuus TaxID=4232 RepID=A0A251S3A3_HELAN|nr:hypothetical protein HanHA300_Chr16g0624571 [Helianthus annuus]KAJ0461721.1 hypothetical protein HanHA89_Chr16g0675531 [Helianthus annuus]KAJ0642124.1 hypothetical protein HanLR1_Chr16g0634851 [Helianthus annuus]KAJ0646005.1 hypothetical protein HanOQP8_Chr16g0630341 [Helianthus annuus]
MFQPCWWVTAKSSHLRHEFDNLPIGAHLAFEPFKKVSLWYLIWGFGLVICWFCGDNFDVGSNLHSHLFLYVASSAFESIMTAIYPFWESLKVTWLKSTNSSMISNSWLGITRPGNSDPN